MSAEAVGKWHATWKDTTVVLGIVVQGVTLVGLLISGIVMLRETAQIQRDTIQNMDKIEARVQKLEVSDAVNAERWTRLLNPSRPR